MAAPNDDEHSSRRTRNMVVLDAVATTMYFDYAVSGQTHQEIGFVELAIVLTIQNNWITNSSGAWKKKIVVR